MSLKKGELKPEVLGSLFGFSLLAFLLPFFLFVNMKSPSTLYIYLYGVWSVVIACLFFVSRRMK